MKKTNTIYWIVTILFAALMLFSAIPNMLLTAESKTFMGALGYPDYFTQLLGVLKLLGVIAILIPVPAVLKEWAYAGLFFDLGGAIYSQIAVWGFNPQILIMLIWVGFGIASYIYFKKRLAAGRPVVA
ncbi:MAG TPA: DoxX family protein [Puia sp.]|nr:DoxX family protein [Puia sp.]